MTYGLHAPALSSLALEEKSCTHDEGKKCINTWYAHSRYVSYRARVSLRWCAASSEIVFVTGHSPCSNDDVPLDAFTAALRKDTDTSRLQVGNCIACCTSLPPNLSANSTSDVFYHVIIVLPSADHCRRSRWPAAQVFTSHSRQAPRQAATVAASATEAPLQLVLYTKEGCPLCDGLQVRLVSQLTPLADPSQSQLRDACLLPAQEKVSNIITRAQFMPSVFTSCQLEVSTGK